MQATESEEGKEERERKKLCKEAKAKKAAEAKAGKDALIKKRMKQAKAFEEENKRSESCVHSIPGKSNTTHELEKISDTESICSFQSEQDNDYFPIDDDNHLDVHSDDGNEPEDQGAYVTSPLKELFQKGTCLFQLVLCCW